MAGLPLNKFHKPHIILVLIKTGGSQTLPYNIFSFSFFYLPILDSVWDEGWIFQAFQIRGVLFVYSEDLKSAEKFNLRSYRIQDLGFRIIPDSGGTVIPIENSFPSAPSSLAITPPKLPTLLPPYFCESLLKIS